jgi:hypothetical protein
MRTTTSRRPFTIRGGALSLALIAMTVGAFAEEVSMESRCQAEVSELHRFFEDWFNGAVPADDETFARFAGVMGEGFVIVTPEGRAVERDTLIEGLRGSHGRWRLEGKGGGRIWIENVDVRHAGDGMTAVTYEEWQEVDGRVRGRISTALFRAKKGAPNGIEWLHVHETWLPEARNGE